ncbi:MULTISPECIES: YraN family protein [unclassified Rathayibacter]|uniref:YraN family protein n=1 Tax=unclassified Rathayibacter TaxID=2609250 RepID=UPI00188C3811|nr:MULTISPECIES: YraN family protein [unclassified Rathayibacter]MBF4462166.1 YraN family protein [Rathayibacter sp. VKM Ac-2879]MBF4503791.1 YraN family protein [Rathayibacter sp. VKM Ac-2878]
MDKDELGRRGEEIAAAHLRAHGFEILDRNWRVREGELDIVAREGAALVVVEVKTRSSTRFGLPVEAITRAKAQRLRRLAYAWAREHGERSRHLRIDAVGIVAPGGVTEQLRHHRAVA